MPARHIALAVLFSILVGLGFPAVKIGMTEAPPLFLTAMRFSLSAIPAVFLIRKPNAPWSAICLYGLFIGVMQFGLLNSAIFLGFPSGLSSLVMQMQVFFTILLAFVLLKERPAPAQILGALIAFCGIVVIGAGRAQLSSSAGAGLLGFVLLLAAALSWGFGNLVAKSLKGVNMFAFTIWTGLVSPLPLLILSYFIEGASAWHALAELKPAFVGSVVYMAFGATLTGFGILNWLLSRHPAAQVMPFALLIPIVGFLSGVILFNETLHMSEIIGAGLIFLGLSVNVFGNRVWAVLRPSSSL